MRARVVVFAEDCRSDRISYHTLFRVPPPLPLVLRRTADVDDAFSRMPAPDTAAPPAPLFDAPYEAEAAVESITNGWHISYEMCGLMHT